ncbi:MAG: hypothetical protein JJ913_08845 [Rhizobiaceae bacterium]|nr:hypothetical protein [Rhizobiaceae bacterium]
MPASSAIIGTCTILIQNNGTLAVNPAIDVLSSLQAGGNAARVTVEPDSLVCSILNLLDCYRLSAPPPVAFVTAPAGGGDTVSFASTYRIDGGAAISGATTTRLINDTYSVDVDLTATRAAGIFPTGSYQAQVTVRCE